MASEVSEEADDDGEILLIRAPESMGEASPPQDQDQTDWIEKLTEAIKILEIDPEIGTFEVKSTSGDGHLGGDDYDEEIIHFLADEFQKQESVDLRKDPMALQRLKEAAEKAKCELSTVMETSINLPYISATQSGPNRPSATHRISSTHGSSIRIAY